MNAKALRQDATRAFRHRSRPVATSQTARTLQVEVLKSLIEHHATGGVERGGHQWAAVPQAVLLSELNARLRGHHPIAARAPTRPIYARNLPTGVAAPCCAILNS
jgi:hypothetical protein